MRSIQALGLSPWDPISEHLDPISENLDPIGVILGTIGAKVTP